MKLSLRCILFMLPAVATLCRGEVLSIPAIKDATLYESPTGGLANGAGASIFAGRTNQETGSIRRAVIEFDLQALPANAVINSATLTLNMVNTAGSAVTIALHRLTREWTEGTTVAGGNGGGGGIPVTGGDATWLHATSPGTSWTGPGAAGDFIGLPSSTAAVGGAAGLYSWTGMVSDLQMWLADSSTNHGWIIIGDETESSSAVRFDSRSSTAGTAPQLIVDFTVVPEPGTALLLVPGLLLLARRRSR